jgi:hypothetical protein
MHLNPATATPVLKTLSAWGAVDIRIQPSSSLQLVPWNLECEQDILAQQPLGSALTFGKQKLKEVSDVCSKAAGTGNLDAYDQAWKSFQAKRQGNSKVTTRAANLAESIHESLSCGRTRTNLGLYGAAAAKRLGQAMVRRYAHSCHRHRDRIVAMDGSLPSAKLQRMPMVRRYAHSCHGHRDRILAMDGSLPSAKLQRMPTLWISHKKIECQRGLSIDLCANPI